jgi:tRNA(Ile)-lysidine synthetase-like protein
MLLQRFRRATVRSHLDLQGKVWQEGDEILEFGPVDEDESTVPDEPLTKSMESFLHTHMHPDNHALIVSLSGGVDSMCALTVLEHISSKMNNLTIVACHVDYGNRPESEAEAEFLQRYCKKRGVTLLLKQLREIQRDVTPRDEYEAESRMARFELYKRAFKEYGCSAVVVGHHKNDVQENVIANVMRGNNIFELGGMYPTGEYILRSEIRCNSTSALPHLIEVQERLKGSRYGDHS